MNRFSKVTMLSGCLALSALALACGGSVATEQPSATAQSAATKAPVLAQAHGQVKLVGEALSEVPLRAEQRTEIEQLGAAAEARHATVVAARKDLMEAVAAQIETGNIDRTALEPKVDAAAQAWETVRPADRAALERLHAVLDAGQRTQFVDAVEANMKAQHGAHGGHGKMMQEWATDLKLTDAQRDQIKTIMQNQFAAHQDQNHAAWKAGHQHGKQVLEAFAQDRFVMDEVAPKVDARTKANEMADRMITVAQNVLPVLTAEQRGLAAQKLRTRAAQVPVDEVSP
jgi:Spy/CpxP family protein refolding chaperone